MKWGFGLLVALFAFSSSASAQECIGGYFALILGGTTGDGKVERYCMCSETITAQKLAYNGLTERFSCDTLFVTTTRDVERACFGGGNSFDDAILACRSFQKGLLPTIQAKAAARVRAAELDLLRVQTEPPQQTRRPEPRPEQPAASTAAVKQLAPAEVATIIVACAIILFVLAAIGTAIANFRTPTAALAVGAPAAKAPTSPKRSVKFYVPYWMQSLAFNVGGGLAAWGAFYYTQMVMVPAPNILIGFACAFGAFIAITRGIPAIMLRSKPVPNLTPPFPRTTKMQVELRPDEGMGIKHDRIVMVRMTIAFSEVQLATIKTYNYDTIIFYEQSKVFEGSLAEPRKNVYHLGEDWSDENPDYEMKPSLGSMLEYGKLLYGLDGYACLSIPVRSHGDAEAIMDRLTAAAKDIERHIEQSATTPKTRRF